MARALTLLLALSALVASTCATAYAAPTDPNARPLFGLPGQPPGGCTLEQKLHVPAGAPASAPLVVALHGCGETADQFEGDSGWSVLADRYHFYVLYPEEERCGNSLSCFNWFLPSQTSRDQGEAGEIKAMIDEVRREHSIDPARIYVTGFSAGAAMATALLASYPEVFAGGAIMSGLPYGIATSEADAWTSMMVGKELPAKDWGDKVRQAVPDHTGTYPRVVIFHGTADYTVVPKNAHELVKQWTNLHGIDDTPALVETVHGHKHSVYKDAQGVAVVELYAINGMPHAIAVEPGDGPEQGGTAGQFAKDVGLYSCFRALQFFGLAH